MVDTSKPVYFYDDRSKVKEILTMTEVLYENPDVCLCRVNDQAAIGQDIGPVLFAKGDLCEVLTTNLEFWYVTNEQPK